MYAQAMSKTLAALLVVLSLLLPSVAQAACVTDMDFCEGVSISPHVDDHGNQNDAQGEKFIHHHCVAHSVVPSVALLASALSTRDSISHPIADEALPSLAVGPLLKPPSHV